MTKTLPFIEVVSLIINTDYDPSECLFRNNVLCSAFFVSTNKMELFVFDHDNEQMVILCARLDNFGKGTSGAAVQDLNLALNLDETAAS